MYVIQGSPSASGHGRYGAGAFADAGRQGCSQGQLPVTPWSLMVYLKKHEDFFFFCVF